MTAAATPVVSLGVAIKARDRLAVHHRFAWSFTLSLLPALMARVLMLVTAQLVADGADIELLQRLDAVKTVGISFWIPRAVTEDDL